MNAQINPNDLIEIYDEVEEVLETMQAAIATLRKSKRELEKLGVELSFSYEEYLMKHLEKLVNGYTESAFPAASVKQMLDDVEAAMSA